MPSVDENSNSTYKNGHEEEEPDELLAYKKCDCCPFGYHIDRDFVPFSKKMLSREGDVQRIQALKDKWRSKRQSMDKLLGLDTESWEIKTITRPNRDVWDLGNSNFRSLQEKLQASIAPLQIDPFDECEFTFGAELDQAVEEFEDVLARTKPVFNTTLFPFPDDQKFHTFPRQKGNGDLNHKSKIIPIIYGPISRPRLDFDEYSSQNGSSNDEKSKVSNNYPPGRYQALEEQLRLIPNLQASLAALQKQNEQYVQLLEIERKRRLDVEQEMLSTRNLLETETEKHRLVRKRTREVSVGVKVTTRDVGVSHVQTTVRSIGVGGRIDTSIFERDSSSPTGSVNGRRLRGRTFETGIQVNEAELLQKKPPPTLLITEKFDAETQADFGQILTTFGFESDLNRKEKVVTKDVGINAKPTTSDCGVYFKPTTREEICNTIQPEMRQKCVGTTHGPLTLRESAMMNLTLASIGKPEVSTIGVNTLHPQISTVGSNTTLLFTTQTVAAQTETIGQNDIGVQINVPIFDLSKTYGVAKSSKSLDSCRSPTYRSTLSHMILTSDLDLECSPLPLSTTPNPKLMRSNTYTKDIPIEDEFLEDASKEKGFNDPKYFPGSSFGMSIPTIPERREAIKPSKEMQGALKVLNDALLRGKTTEHVTSAIGIILHEWFRVSGSKSANAHDVEDYLDMYENYSPELLKYIVNMPDGNGNSAIHYAVSHGNFDVVSVLLDSNCCDINRANKAGYTCIMLLSLAKLSYETDRHVVCRLCQLGDVNIKATQHGQTALMLAASHGRLETCKILLDSGADINIQDDDGSTALMCAAEHGHVELVNYFVTLPECDLHITDNDGSTALNVAMEANHKDAGVTLYAHMHLVDSPTGQGQGHRRRLSYPPVSPLFPFSNSKSPSPPISINRSAGNSPGTKKKLRENILANEPKKNKGTYGGGTESA